LQIAHLTVGLIQHVMQIAGDQSRHVLPLTSRYPAVRRSRTPDHGGNATARSASPSRICHPAGSGCGWPLDWMPYHLEASVPGVVVVGDARAESAEQVAAAVGEGAMSVMLVHRYLEKL
jgi:hypothetical protein